jgi:hypothetical protein
MMHIVQEKKEEAKPMMRNLHEKRTVYARLQAAGIPVPVENDSAVESDLVVQRLKGSRAYDLKMGSEFLFNLRISNHSYGNLEIRELRGHLLEADWELIFQGDPREHVPGRKMYRMLSGRRVRYASVLNHRLSEGIASGATIEGKLLASSVTEKIPGDCTHVCLKVILTDQYGRDHASIIEILVDRSATMAKPKVFKRTSGSLYRGSPPAPELQYRAPSQVEVRVPGWGENAEKRPAWVKKFIELLGRSDLDTMLAQEMSKAGEPYPDPE